MKLNKKKVFTLALAVCLIAILSMSSLAWFTDDDSVTNDFFIAGSEDENPDDVFSIDVWEKDEDGKRYDDEGIDYPAILPGDDLYKEVNVENTGAYEQYARVIVTVSDAHIWQELHGEIYVPLNKIATDLSSEFQPWSIEYDAEANTLTYVLYYNHILAVDEVVNLFTNVAIPEEMDRYQAAEMAGGFQIGVVAEAVQTEHVGANAAEAFATVGKAIEAGNRTINLNTENVSDVLDILAGSEDAQIALDLTGYVLDKPVSNKGTLEITGGTIVAPDRGFSNSGAVILNDVKMTTGSATAYGNVTEGAGAKTIYNNVDIDSNGGGVVAAYGAAVEFNGGSVTINSTSTSQRHIFYAEGEGSVITVNGGEYAFDAYRQRTYACAVNGATVYITGGTFGVAPNHPRWTAPIYEVGGEVIITGGTFGFNPTEWVADGYQAVENNGVWTVSAK
jgi:predicted ribosomally synthesized peptide with SipW-like signal peptide